MEKNSGEDSIYNSMKLVKRKDDEKVLLLDKVPTNLLRQVIDVCRDNKSIYIRVKPSDIERLDQLGINTNSGDLNMYYYCDTIAEAPVSMLTKHGIKEILVGARENTCARKIDILKYSIIRYKLERIVADLDGKSDKEKFKTIYTRLANMIDYDQEATKTKSEYAKLNEETCRNLENAVLLNTAVCQGYCEVLRQTLSLVGIESIICYSMEGEDETSHTYNMVKLDGKWFNTDLTWDYSNIRRKIRPKYCLKSDEDFLKCSEKDKLYHLPDDITVPKCNTSVELYPEFRGHSRRKNRRVSNKKISIAEIVQKAIKRGKKIKEMEKLPAAEKSTFKEQIKTDTKPIEPKQSETHNITENIHMKDDEISK